MRSIAHPAALTFARIRTRTHSSSQRLHPSCLPPSLIHTLCLFLPCFHSKSPSLWAPSLCDQSAKQTPPLKKRSLTEHGLPVPSPKLAPAPTSPPLVLPYLFLPYHSFPLVPRSIFRPCPPGVLFFLTLATSSFLYPVPCPLSRAHCSLSSPPFPSAPLPLQPVPCHQKHHRLSPRFSLCFPRYPWPCQFRAHRPRCCLRLTNSL
jgi:hypothetical protein